jgi:hypothetical protein
MPTSSNDDGESGFAKREPGSNVNRERYLSYMRGWDAGASNKLLDKKFTEHATRPDLKMEYEKGYAAGRGARRYASNVAARRLKYEPTILRAAGSRTG